jgi:hypothetical protein
MEWRRAESKRSASGGNYLSAAISVVGQLKCLQLHCDSQLFYKLELQKESDCKNDEPS